MGLGDIVDNNKDEEESTTTSSSSSTSNSSSSSSSSNSQPTELFQEVAEFNPEEGESPKCPGCKTKGRPATTPDGDQEMYYFRCTSPAEECDVIQYQYSKREDRLVRTEKDGFQKEIIQKKDYEETQSEQRHGDKEKTKKQKWDDFLEGVDGEDL